MTVSTYNQLLPLHILLVDDNEHESVYFKHALSELSTSTRFNSTDGKRLMDHLFKNIDGLPDVLFLDLNMPCKNGFECLNELKASEKFQHIPVIIYSSSFDKKVADELYKNGAHYYIQKTDVIELKKILDYFLAEIVEGLFMRPSRENFLLSITGQSCEL